MFTASRVYAAVVIVAMLLHSPPSNVVGARADNWANRSLRTLTPLPQLFVLHAPVREPSLLLRLVVARMRPTETWSSS